MNSDVEDLSTCVALPAGILCMRWPADSNPPETELTQAKLVARWGLEQWAWPLSGDSHIHCEDYVENVGLDSFGEEWTSQIYIRIRVQGGAFDGVEMFGSRWNKLGRVRMAHLALCLVCLTRKRSERL